MFVTPDFWVFVAFMLFIGFFGKKATTFLLQFIDRHTQTIANQLKEAQHLHDEALSLLASYKKKHADAVLEAEKITSAAKIEALEFKKASELEFSKLLAQKEKNFLERLEIEIEEAKAKLRNQAVDEAIAIVEDVLLAEPKERTKLTQISLKEISTLKVQTKDKLH